MADLRQSGWFVLTGFLHFLRHPTATLDAPIAVSRPATAAWLLLFSFGSVVICSILAAPLIFSQDMDLGAGLKAVSAQPTLSVIVAVVILGPLVEEILFRGWLPLTPSAVAGSAIFLGVWFGGSWLLREWFPGSSGLGGSIAVAVFAALAASLASRVAPPSSPIRHRLVFPILFWAQGIAFGALHFGNVASASPILPVLMVTPLVICGWLWGYARIALGFGAAWGLHMAYNVPPAIGMIVLATF